MRSKDYNFFLGLGGLFFCVAFLFLICIDYAVLASLELAMLTTLPLN